MNIKTGKYIFIVLSALSILMIAVSGIKDGLMNPVRNVVGFVLVPIQAGVNRAGLNIYNALLDHTSAEDLKMENEELKSRIDDLKEENNRLLSETEELTRLRELYELDQDYAEYEKVAARVIAKDSENWFQVFRIDKGSKDGIKIDQNVMANGGLIGIVTDVGLNYATVRSIIDDESRVSAIGLHSQDSCIVAGDLTLYENGRLRITDLDKSSDMGDGDRIVTSQFSSKYLPGILIGYAVDIETDEKRLLKRGYLIPAADFSNLSEVLVLKRLKSEYFIKNDSGIEEDVPEDIDIQNDRWSGMAGLTPLEEILDGRKEEETASQDSSLTDAAVTTE